VAPTGRAAPTRVLDGTPPSYCCGPTFDYCTAKSHSHEGSLATIYLKYYDRGLAVSDCLGNLLVAKTWSGQPVRFWYHWGSDDVVKISVWTNKPEWLEIHYCTLCMMAVSVTSPSFPTDE
jgi:hypothetical protein